MFSQLSLRGLLLSAALLCTTSVFAADAADEIQVVDAYARAVPPGQPNSALFMTLTNSGSTDRALVEASSLVANKVELHNHIDDNGVMRMRRVEKIDIPAGGSAELKPGGYHVMLIGLHQQLTPEQEVTVQLSFDDGSQTSFVAPVRSVMQMQMGHEHMHHGGMGDSKK
jgi:copper(I)-binding protein